MTREDVVMSFFSFTSLSYMHISTIILTAQHDNKLSRFGRLFSRHDKDISRLINQQFIITEPTDEATNEEE